MEHVPHTRQAAVVRSGGEGGIFRKDPGKQVSGEETFFGLPVQVIGIVHRGQRAAVFLQCQGAGGQTAQEKQQDEHA